MRRQKKRYMQTVEEILEGLADQEHLERRTNPQTYKTEYRVSSKFLEEMLPPDDYLLRNWCTATECARIMRENNPKIGSILTAPETVQNAYLKASLKESEFHTAQAAFELALACHEQIQACDELIEQTNHHMDSYPEDKARYQEVLTNTVTRKQKALEILEKLEQEAP